MLGGIAPIAGHRLTCVFEVYFDAISDNLTGQVPGEGHKFGDTDAPFYVLKSFFGIIKASERGIFQSAIRLENSNKFLVGKFDRYED